MNHTLFIPKGDVSPEIEESAQTESRDFFQSTHDALSLQTAFLAAQADSSTDGILVVDAKGKKILQNQRLNQLLSIPSHIAEDKNDRAQLRWVMGIVRNPKEFAEKVRFLYSHPEAHSRDEVELKDGTVLDRHSAPLTGPDGKYYGRLWTFRDITEPKIAQREVQQLERKVAELQENEKSLLRAIEHERELHQEKSRFVSMVSHEFRTPLCVIGMAASLLDKYFETMTAEEKSLQLKSIQGSVKRMNQMMQTLLLHGRFENGNIGFKPSWVDLEAFCRRMITEATNLTNKPEQIEFLIDPGAIDAFVDESILSHVLGNLLSNAIKYSQEDSPVTLEVKRVSKRRLAGDSRDATMEKREFKSGSVIVALAFLPRVLPSSFKLFIEPPMWEPVRAREWGLTS